MSSQPPHMPAWLGNARSETNSRNSSLASSWRAYGDANETMERTSRVENSQRCCARVMSLIGELRSRYVTVTKPNQSLIEWTRSMQTTGSGRPPQIDGRACGLCLVRDVPVARHRYICGRRSQNVTATV